jgi:hypothetical protein
MDPVSISVSVLAIITACAQVVKILKETIETLKKAAEFLLQLLSQTERVRLFLEQLRSLTEQLRARSDILLAFSPSGPEATINELNVFVRDMAQKPKLMKLKMLLKRSTADELVKKLHRHEVEITQVLLSVATLVSPFLFLSMNGCSILFAEHQLLGPRKRFEECEMTPYFVLKLRFRSARKLQLW